MNISKTPKQPCNIDAEKALIGALLINNDNIDKISDIIKPEHFYLDIHKEIYRNILVSVNKSLIATIVTLRNHLQENIFFKEIKYDEYMPMLVADATVTINIKSFAIDIKESYMKRSLISLGEYAIEDSYKYENEAKDTIENIEKDLYSLSVEGEIDSRNNKVEDIISDVIREISDSKGKERTGVPSGFYDLDKALNGFQDSDLIILAARPSMGKTALAVNFAVNSAQYLKKQEKSALIFSLEMSSKQLSTRILSMKTKINSSKLRSAKVTKEEFSNIVEQSKTISALPLFIDDSASLNIPSIRTKIRRMKRKHNIGLVIIDYLQLITSLRKSSDSSRVLEIGDITRGLKSIAKELSIPIIALSQLSRAVEQRNDKRPHLADLRESGNIEQDADIVMFIYREQYYLERETSADKMNDHEWQMNLDAVKNKAEIMIAKHRNGPTANISLGFDGNTTTFFNYTSDMEAA